jgi:hypothetical protein
LMRYLLLFVEISSRPLSSLQSQNQELLT